MCLEHIETAFALHLPIVPVVEDATRRRDQVPTRLEYLKTITWRHGQEIPDDLLETVRETLGIADRQRRIFISYCQRDAGLIAIQLHHALSARRFGVFLDQFETSPAENIQERIAEALEDMACVLLLHSPNVHSSNWVDHEITRAINSQLPVLVIRWSNATVDIRKVEAAGFPTFPLNVDSDLDQQGRVREPTLDAILNWVEHYHADGHLRRRQESIGAAKQFARERGWTIAEEPRWKLVLTRPSGGSQPVLLGLTPRLTKTEDLYELDRWPLPELPVTGVRWRKVVLQTSSELPQKRMAVLEWVAEARDMGVAPGVNALGYFL